MKSIVICLIFNFIAIVAYSQEKNTTKKSNYTFIDIDFGIGPDLSNDNDFALFFSSSLTAGYQFNPYFGLGISGNGNLSLGYTGERFGGFALNYRGVIKQKFIVKPYFGFTTYTYYSTDCQQCSSSKIDDKSYPFYGVKLLLDKKIVRFGLTYERCNLTLREEIKTNTGTQSKISSVGIGHISFNVCILLKLKNAKTTFYD